LIVALLMPATSPALSSITSVLKPFLSQYLRYWRSSIWHQSCASVPPAPACRSRKAVERILGLVEHAPELEPGDRRLELGRLGLDREQAVEVLVGLRHLVQLGVVGEVRRQVVDRLDHGLERALLAAELLRPLRLVPDLGVLEGGVDLVQAQRLAVVVKDTPGGRPCASSGRPAGCRWH
jgi:hypothetical protein